MSSAIYPDRFYVNGWGQLGGHRTIWYMKLDALAVASFCKGGIYRGAAWVQSLILVCDVIKNVFFNRLRRRQNGCHFPDDIFKCFFLSENVWILLKISLKFSPRGPINNMSALGQIMAWRQPGNKPLSEPMVVGLLTHIWVTRPQWVKLWLDTVWTPILDNLMMNCHKLQLGQHCHNTF